MKDYGLPPPWDPGYAVPRYVEAEPPARGAMVTQWLPRGTISAVVPEYRLGVGRKLLGRVDTQLGPPLGSLGGSSLAGSTLGGSSLAGSCFSGDTLGATAYQLQPMGNAGSPSVISQYGLKTARGMIASVKRLHPSQRAAALKSAMARIDKTLQTRTERYAQQARASGTPKAQALEVGLARALSEGVVGELAKLGQSRSLPQPSSLLGLGLNRAHERAQGAYVGLGNVASTALSKVSPVLTTTASTATARGERMVQVGPFTFPVGDKPFVIANGLEAVKAIPRAWHGYISRALRLSDQELKDLAASLTKVSVSPTAFKTLMSVAAAPKNAIWQDALHIYPGLAVTLRAISPMMTTGKWSDHDDGRAMPIATFTHPETGNKWGVFLGMSGDKLNPTGVQLYVKWLPEQPWYTRALGWIANIPAVIIDAVGTAVDWVKDQTCALINNPNAAMAAGAANPAAGAGVIVAQSICGGAPAPVPMPMPTTSNTLMYILLAGGGLLAAIALTKQE